MLAEAPQSVIEFGAVQVRDLFGETLAVEAVLSVVLRLPHEVKDRLVNPLPGAVTSHVRSVSYPPARPPLAGSGPLVHLRPWTHGELGRV